MSYQHLTTQIGGAMIYHISRENEGWYNLFSTSVRRILPYTTNIFMKLHFRLNKQPDQETSDRQDKVQYMECFCNSSEIVRR